ncbi:hypothetical protein BG006_001144 [Podila minutissima]|uniref:Uncharacterized protein n=1 Tax=Podila minutissima TaxID=64525 RepID=A0A9P5SRS3_9FUNG|nr:hypothetical protein BG006_001144 [Podila minutissima]
MASNEMPVGQARYYHDKKAFITAQVRLLEAPVQLPSDWRRARSRLNNDGTAHTSIPDSVVSSVLGKVHANTRKSLRLSYNHQSLRQLLEQLESNQHDLRKKARRGGIIIRTKPVREILESSWIDMFPETWQPNNRQDTENRSAQETSSSVPEAALSLPTGDKIPSEATDSLQAQRYADMRSRIVALQAKHQTLLEKHRYYKNLNNEVQRLDVDDIQKNIVSPNSEVVKELQKMKQLLPKLIRVLDSKQDTMSVKRKLPSRHSGASDSENTKRSRLESTNPLATMMDYLQE